eukprot:TRINITY_DN2336_c0_g1_i4.p1 TRINITY_DN2336_c0_g1~~TRINITY_DN2336_c0_g1_i4.p1  ORF type:complete len:755 (-),score=69.75 TRINITY_DN2336_c0_g1_i4:73-2337(-)
MLESRDIQLEKIRYFYDFRMASLINCKKLLASISKNFDRKSGTLKVFPVKNEDGNTEYVLLDGTHRYICYKYLYKLDVPVDILKDSMEEWEWFYIAGGGNVISSTHVPMDIYSKIKLIGEIMEKKIDGKALKANDAKPIIQKNVPGFQDKCSKEIINAYNRMYKSYKRKYLDMIQQVVMKKDAKLHSMVKDNLELPSLMSLEDSNFKEELFQKMGETKMSKNDLIIQINKHKFTKFVKNQLEDDHQKENIIEKIEKGKYDKNLIEEDSFIREGQLQDTKLWRKLQKLATQEDDSTRKKAESDDIDREGSVHDNSMGHNLIIPQMRKRKSDTAWESNIAKKRKEAQSNSNDHRNTIEGPLRFNTPCELSIPSRRESQFMLINGEVYLSLTFLEYDKYKLLKTLCRAKLLNTSIDTHNTTRLSIIDTDSIHIDDDNDEEAIALIPDNNGLADDSFDFASKNSDKGFEEANNNNQKVSVLEQSISSLQVDDEEKDIVSNKYNDGSREKSEKKSSKNKRKKDKDKRHKKEKKDKKHRSKQKKQQKSNRTLDEVGLRVPEKEDDKNVQDKPDDEYPDNLSGVERMERDASSYDENHFDNDDEADQASESAQNEDIESEIISNNNRTNNEDNDDDQAGNTTLIRQIKQDYYKKIERVFTGRDTSPRIRQWKSGHRDFPRHSGGFSAPELKAIFGLLTEWSKHLNQVNLKFEDEEELSQFVLDVLWYELAYRLLSDRDGITQKEAKARLERSPELVNVDFE